MCLLALTPLRHSLSPFAGLPSVPASHLLQLQILDHDARSPREGTESRPSQAPLQQTEEQPEDHKVLARVTSCFEARAFTLVCDPKYTLRCRSVSALELGADHSP